MLMRILPSCGTVTRLSKFMSSTAYAGAHRPSGALRQRPEIMRFGILRSLSMGLPFICLGAYISREGAALLEEMDIFVPSDDDDD
ncbi:UPF0466 protein C22orf32 mitochondrial [Clonorchis sinensis]|uniref:Essential MCU regulator, mitochondrial n=1 Tax=Clonorchis sinensis TaxID=79923 RepID=H2KVL5_CLOSI|nr:UPF0466 protein C22orf32 mitochondrial [Clonorchis sinensis]